MSMPSNTFIFEILSSLSGRPLSQSSLALGSGQRRSQSDGLSLVLVAIYFIVQVVDHARQYSFSKIFCIGLAALAMSVYSLCWDEDANAALHLR